MRDERHLWKAALTFLALAVIVAHVFYTFFIAEGAWP